MLVLEPFPTMIKPILFAVIIEAKRWDGRFFDIPEREEIAVSVPSGGVVRYNCKTMKIDAQWISCDIALVHWVSEECAPIAFFVRLVNAAYRAIQYNTPQYVYEVRPIDDFVDTPLYYVSDKEQHDDMYTYRLLCVVKPAVS